MPKTGQRMVVKQLVEKVVQRLAPIPRSYIAAEAGEGFQGHFHSTTGRLCNEVCSHLKAIQEQGSPMEKRLTRHLFGRLLSTTSRFLWSLNTACPQDCELLQLAQQVCLSNQVRCCQRLVALLCTFRSAKAIRQLHEYAASMAEPPEPIAKETKTRDALKVLQQAFELLASVENRDEEGGENPETEGSGQPGSVCESTRPNVPARQFTDSYAVEERAAAKEEDALGRFTRAMHLLAVVSKQKEDEMWQRLLDIAEEELQEGDIQNAWRALADFQKSVENNKLQRKDELHKLKASMANRVMQKHPEMVELSVAALEDTDLTVFGILADPLFPSNIQTMDGLADAIADQSKGVIGGALICPVLGVPFTPSGDLQPLRLPCHCTISRKAWQAASPAADRCALESGRTPVKSGLVCPACKEGLGAQPVHPHEDSWILQRMQTVGLMFGPHIDPKFLQCQEQAAMESERVVLKRGCLMDMPVLVHEVDLGVCSQEGYVDSKAHTYVGSLIGTAMIGSLLSPHVLDPIATCIEQSDGAWKVRIVYHSCEGLLTLDGCLKALEQGALGGKRVTQLPAADLALLGLEITDAMIGLHEELRVPPFLVFSELVFQWQKSASGTRKLSSRLMVSPISPAHIAGRQGSCSRKVQDSLNRCEEGKQLGAWLKGALGHQTRALPEKFLKLIRFIARMLHGQSLPLAGIRIHLQAILQEFAVVGALPRLMQPNHRLLDLAYTPRKFAPGGPVSGSPIAHNSAGRSKRSQEILDELGDAEHDLHVAAQDVVVNGHSVEGSEPFLQYSLKVNGFMQLVVQQGNFQSHLLTAGAGTCGASAMQNPATGVDLQDQPQHADNSDDGLAREVEDIAKFQLPTLQPKLCPLQAIVDRRLQKVVTRVQCFAQVMQDRLQRRRAAADADKETEELISVAEMVYLDHQIDAIQTVLAIINLAYIAQRARPRDVLKPALIHLESYLEKEIAGPVISTITPDSTMEACKQLHATLCCLYDAAEYPIDHITPEVPGSAALVLQALFAVREVQALSRETHRPDACWLHDLQRMLADVFNHPELAALCGFQAQVQDKVQQLRDGRVPGFRGLTQQLLMTAFDTMSEKHQGVCGHDLFPGPDSWLGSEESVLCVLMDRELSFPEPLNTQQLADLIVKGIRCGSVVAGCPILGLPFVKRPRNARETTGLDPGQLPCCGCVASRHAFNLNRALGACQVCGELMRPEDSTQTHLFSEAEITPLARWASFNCITPAVKGPPRTSRKAPQPLPTLALNVKGAAPSALRKCWRAVDAARTAGLYSPFVREPLAIQQDGDQRRVVWCASSGPTLSDLLRDADLSALDVVELGLQFMDALHAIHEHALSQHGSIQPGDVLFWKNTAGRHWLLLQPSFDTAGRAKASGGPKQVMANDIKTVGELLWDCLQRCNMSAQRLTGEVARAQACRALLWMLVSNMCAGAVVKRKYVERVLLHLWQELILLEREKAKLIGPEKGHESLAARLVSMRRGDKGRSSMWWHAKVSSKNDLDPEQALTADSHLKPFLCLLHHSLNVHCGLTNALGMVLLSTRGENIGLLFNLCGIEPTSNQPARDCMFRVQAELQSSGRWALEACAISNHTMTARPRGLKNICLSLPTDVDLLLDGIPSLILQNVRIGGDPSPIPDQPCTAGDPAHPRIYLKGATESAHLENVHIAGCFLAVEHARVVARGLSLEGAANQLVGLDVDAQATVGMWDVYISDVVRPLQQQRPRSFGGMGTTAGAQPEGPKACAKGADSDEDSSDIDKDGNKASCGLEVSQSAQFTDVDLHNCCVCARSNASLDMQNCTCSGAGLAASVISTEAGASVTLKQVKIASSCTAVTIGEKSRARLEDCHLAALKPPSSRAGSGDFTANVTRSSSPKVTPEVSLVDDIAAAVSTAKCVALTCSAGAAMHYLAESVATELGRRFESAVWLRLPWQGPHGRAMMEQAAQQLGINVPVCASVKAGWRELMGATRGVRVLLVLENVLWPREIEWLVDAGMGCWAADSRVVAATRGDEGDWEKWKVVKCTTGAGAALENQGISPAARMKVLGEYGPGTSGTDTPRLSITSAILAGQAKQLHDDGAMFSGVVCRAGSNTVMRSTTVVAQHGHAVNSTGTLNAHLCSFQATGRLYGWIHNNLYVHSGSQTSLTDCKLNGGGRGMCVEDEGSLARLTSCELIKNDNTGAIIQKAGEAELQSCTIRDTVRFQGLHVRDEGTRVHFVGCHVTSNNDAGLYVQQAAIVRLSHCFLCTSKSSQGVCVQGNGSRLDAESCVLADNWATGAWIRLGAAASFNECKFAGSKCYPGVDVHDPGTRVDLYNCRIYDVKDAGVSVHNGATTFMTQTTVRGSRTHGARVYDQDSRLHIYHSNIEDNYLAGVLVDANASSVLDRCTVAGTSQGPGVHVRSSRALFIGCHVERNSGSGILLQDRSPACLRRCVFEGNAISGVHLDSRAHAGFTSCRFTEEGHCIVAGQGTSVEARHCYFNYSTRRAVDVNESDVVLHYCRYMRM